MDDLYELLDVRPDATDDEIKKAYRQKAREHHPDATGGDPESEAKFKEVSFAYEVLRDPERRARYDQFGPASFGQNGAAGAQGFGFDGGLGDLFEAFFGSMAGTAGRGRRRGPQPGADAEVTLQLDVRRGRVRRPQGAGHPSPGHLRDVRRQRGRGRHGADGVPGLPGHR